MRAGTKAALAIILGMAAGVGPGAVAQANPPRHATTIPDGQRVDINGASLEQLLKIPGMTATWAGRIVRFRPYRSKNELLDRGIVSGEVYHRIKEYVVAHRTPAGGG